MEASNGSMCHYLWKKIGNYARTVEKSNREISDRTDLKGTEGINRERRTSFTKINIARHNKHRDEYQFDQKLEDIDKIKIL